MNERNGGTPEDGPREARHGGKAQEPDSGTGADTGRHDGRGETEEERADRRWQELLQEIRVAQTGVQILLGFRSSTTWGRPTRRSTWSRSSSGRWRRAR